MSGIFHQGDIVYIDFDPQTGHEQRGRRPALVVSNDRFNCMGKGAFLCPITNTNRGVPIQVPLDSRTQTTGVIMCDQTKALDTAMRGATFVEKAPPDIVAEVADIIIGLVELV